jgi:hypothetical protein
MPLKPEISLGVGLATATVVYGVYSTTMPTVADLRKNEMDDPDAAATDKSAAWLSAAVVAGISLIAKDATVFIIGGSMVVALSWFYKHANAVNPEFSMAVPKSDNLPEQFDDSTMADAENYANSANAEYSNF